MSYVTYDLLVKWCKKYNEDRTVGTIILVILLSIVPVFGLEQLNCSVCFGDKLFEDWKHQASIGNLCHKNDSSILDCLLSVDEGKTTFAIASPYEMTCFKKYLKNSVAWEIKNKNETKYPTFEFVALVKNTNFVELEDLHDRKLCLPSCLSSPFSMNIIYNFLGKILKEKIPRKDLIAEVHKKFGDSCMPGAWYFEEDVDHEMKKECPKLCKLCEPECKISDDVDSFDFVLTCFNYDGEIAFTTTKAIRNINQSAIYLYPNGSSGYEEYIWFHIPGSLVITNEENLERTKSILAKYERGQDNSKNKLMKEEPLKQYIDDNIRIKFENLVDQTFIKWCTCTEDEFEKCRILNDVLHLQDIQIGVHCTIMTELACLDSIHKEEADIVVSRNIKSEINRNKVEIIPLNTTEVGRILILRREEDGDIEKSYNLNHFKGMITKSAKQIVKNENITIILNTDEEFLIPKDAFAVITCNEAISCYEKLKDFKLICSSMNERIPMPPKDSSINCSCAYCIPYGNNAYIGKNNYEKVKNLFKLIDKLFGKKSDHPFKIFGKFKGNSDVLFEDTMEGFSSEMFRKESYELNIRYSNGLQDSDSPTAIDKTAIIFGVIGLIAAIVGIIVGYKFMNRKWNCKANKSDENSGRVQHSDDMLLETKPFVH